MDWIILSLGISDLFMLNRQDAKRAKIFLGDLGVLAVGDIFFMASLT